MTLLLTVQYCPGHNRSGQSTSAPGGRPSAPVSVTETSLRMETTTAVPALRAANSPLPSPAADVVATAGV